MNGQGFRVSPATATPDGVPPSGKTFLFSETGSDIHHTIQTAKATQLRPISNVQAYVKSFSLLGSATALMLARLEPEVETTLALAWTQDALSALTPSPNNDMK